MLQSSSQRSDGQRVSKQDRLSVHRLRMSGNPEYEVFLFLCSFSTDRCFKVPACLTGKMKDIS